MEDQVQDGIEGIGLVGRMLRVFYAPGEAFEAVLARRTWLDWFVPTLIIAIAGSFAAYKIGPLAAQEKMAQIVESIQNNRDLPADKKAEVIAGIEERARKVGTGWSLAAAPAGAFIGVFLLGAILLAFAKFALGGEVNYGQMLAVTAYSSLIGLLRTIVVTPLILAKETIDIHTGLGVILSEEMAKTFAGRVIAGFDLFGLWTTCVVAMGIAVLGNLPTRKAMTGMLILWVIWILIKAGFAGLAAMFMPGG